MDKPEWISRLVDIMIKEEFFDIDRDDWNSCYWEWDTCFNIASKSYNEIYTPEQFYEEFLK